MSAENPLVSIITPAYNASADIEASIKSAIEQTYSNWEMLITDDCSTDNTREIILRYSNIDPRVILLQNKVNSGPAEARNNSLNIAKGRYIAFLDSDDLWLPEKLESQIGYMNQKECGFCFTQYRRFVDLDETGRLIDVPDKKITYSQLLKGNCIYTSTVLIDKEVSGEFKMTKTFYDDYVLWLELLKKGVHAYGLKKDLMRYRVRKGSVSRNKLNSAKEVWKLFRDEEQLPLIKRIWYFGHWGMHNVAKYSSF